MKPKFFAKPTEFRKWLEANHATAKELIVGFYKVGSGKPSMTWPESVDEALCYGWIDGVRRSIDANSYSNRFTPRRKGSFWSNKNIASVQRLLAAGRMQPAGLKAFAARVGQKSGAYSFEQVEIVLGPALEKRFKANKAAWAFFNAQPPSYQKSMRHWVTSAKQEATQLRRLDRLIEVSAQELRVDLLAPFGKK